MKLFSPSIFFLLLSILSLKSEAQVFPNPATLSTGQGAAGTFDPIWTVSPWYSANPPNPMGLPYAPALINNNCAPGSWVDPASLPAPVNNGNWITGTNTPCANNTNDGYLYFRLTLNLPADCNGNSVAAIGNYVLYLQGYADNMISDVFVNGNSTGITGGSFTSPLNITLNGPWLAGINYVDVLVYNFPNGGNTNPYGLLLVANSVASSGTDTDGDGIPDINDQCPCLSGGLANGCAPVVITGDTVLCVGETTILRATGVGTNFWNNGVTGDSIIVSPLVNARYSVVSTASNGYTDSSVVHVTVNALPVALINPAAITICNGASVTLTTIGGTGYLWNTTATTAVIAVAPSITTSYSVTVTDANSCTAAAISNVTVNSLPIPGINPSSITICNGNNTTLTATGGTNYLWSDASVTPAITVSPTNTTTYTVTVTDVNTCSATISSTVTVNQLPIAGINPSTVSICAGDNTTLTASGGTAYAWSDASNTPAITVSPIATITYSVTVMDANTCTATASSDVTVNSLPVAMITPAATTICFGVNTTLTASGGTGFVWSDASNNAALTVTPNITTNYSVTVTDANTCTATASGVVTVIPAIVLSVSNTNLACNSDNSGSIDLTATGGQTPLSYLWNTTDVTEDLFNLAAGNYTVTTTDNFLCTATATTFITEPSLLTVTSSFTNPACETRGNDGTIMLNTSGGTQPYQFIWSTGAGTSGLLNLAPGNYSVTVSDANNCTSESAFTLVYTYDFSVQATPSATIKLGENTTIGFTLNGNAGNYVSVWNPSSTLSCSDCVAPVAAPTVSTLYQIEIKNDAGCISIDTVSVNVIPDYSVYIPNSFTPNGDGNNDLFQIFGNMKALEFLQVQVFNRIGELVFESNDHNFTWDGTYKGSPVSPGVFIWQLKLTFINGHHEEIKRGSLTLLR